MLKPEILKGAFRKCGYSRDLLRSNFPYGNKDSIPLMGFAHMPADSRSACFAVLSNTANPRQAVEACRPLGTPVVFVCFEDTLQWWKQGATSPEWLMSVPEKDAIKFIDSHRDDFSPDAVYRAKTWGRFRSKYQLNFVDVGLMPLIEEEVGEALGGLIERNVSNLKNQLGWDTVTTKQGHWLLKTVFWLVSGKILRDKEVSTFNDLDLSDVDDVFLRVANHYGTVPFSAGSKQKLEALKETSKSIEQFSSLSLTTTESLGYVYENTLISKQTRSSLGTHSTPSFLVDYILGNLSEWIREIPESERSVYEPACGHAAFLVSAMRLLAELLPADKTVPSRRRPYLRSRLHGTDIDSFALELARLSLSLTDIPNPDGWDLEIQDMFVGNRLAEKAKKNTIFLSNPPFANFSPQEREWYLKKGVHFKFMNRTAEMLSRTLPNLSPGSVFGVVVPQTFLHSTNASEIRRFLIKSCELKEICLFPDNVFSFSDAETAILIGRVLPHNSRIRSKIKYSHVREKQLDLFRESFHIPQTEFISQTRFGKPDSFSLRAADLGQIWSKINTGANLDSIADIGKGLEFKGRDLPEAVFTYSKKYFENAVNGFVRFRKNLNIHELPDLYWMNISEEAIRCPGKGLSSETPQVLLNYAPVSRGPWRLKALIDYSGYPVTSRFVAIRPRDDKYSLEFIWALLNSPIANAYAFSHLSKRDNSIGILRRMPVPSVNSVSKAEEAAIAYLKAVTDDESADIIQNLLLQVDIEIMKLYSLSVEQEWALLQLFNGYARVGVTFEQSRYFPNELEQPIRLSDFMQYERNWSHTNQKRGELIDKKVKGVISENETRQLNKLQAYADYYLEKHSPRPTQILEDLEERLFSNSIKK